MGRVIKLNPVAWRSYVHHLKGEKLMMDARRQFYLPCQLGWFNYPKRARPNLADFMLNNPGNVLTNLPSASKHIESLKVRPL